MSLNRGVTKSGVTKSGSDCITITNYNYFATKKSLSPSPSWILVTGGFCWLKSTVSSCHHLERRQTEVEVGHARSTLNLAKHTEFSRFAVKFEVSRTPIFGWVLICNANRLISLLVHIWEIKDNSRDSLELSFIHHTESISVKPKNGSPRNFEPRNFSVFRKVES